MCYAIPALVTKINGDEAIVDYGGVIKNINISMVSNVSVGSYVLVHTGFAIEVLDAKRAQDSIEQIKNMVDVFD